MASASPTSAAPLKQEAASLQRRQQQLRDRDPLADLATSTAPEEEDQQQKRQKPTAKSAPPPKLQPVNGWGLRAQQQREASDREAMAVSPELALARLSDGLPSLAAFLAAEAELDAGEGQRGGPPRVSSLKSEDGPAGNEESLEAATASPSSAAAPSPAFSCAPADSAAAASAGATGSAGSVETCCDESGAASATRDDATSGGGAAAPPTPRRRQRVVGPELYLRWQMLAKKVERVKGVCYSSTRHEWIAVGPVQHGSSGRKKNVYFSVPRYGFSEARQLAVECRKRQEEILAGGGDKTIDAAAIAAELTEKYKQRAGAAAAAAAAAGIASPDADDSEDLERLGITLGEETDEGSKTDTEEAAAADTDSSRGRTGGGGSGSAGQGAGVAGGRPYELRKRRPTTAHLSDDEATDVAFRRSYTTRAQQLPQQANPRKRGRPPRARGVAPAHSSHDLHALEDPFAAASAQHQAVHHQPHRGVLEAARMGAGGISMSGSGSASHTASQRRVRAATSPQELEEFVSLFRDCIIQHRLPSSRRPEQILLRPIAEASTSPPVDAILRKYVTFEAWRRSCVAALNRAESFGDLRRLPQLRDAIVYILGAD
ncbi:hypothetical protein cyc_03779 [Cyclospora cayetanensis]|uniref:Uncharacterized protein n=1 Tax=Cyclospora cayetanensis TaxID=88456 RepID=A0A1D3D1L1_9EIME|nr:hypothetical protein cyc_03779 [Cyclospora cayetanensis]